MKNKNKPIHLITCGYHCSAICDKYVYVVPIEAILKLSNYHSACKGTFNPKKVTCKRCLKHPDYKIAMEKIKYPLLYWRERV